LLLITLQFTESVPKNTPLNFQITSVPLYSINNSQLENYIFTGKLYEFNPAVSSAAVKQIANQTAAASKVGVCTSVALSFISNPAATWAIINTIQLVQYLPLSDNPLTVGLRAFFTGLGGYNIVPSPIGTFLNPSATSDPYPEALNYGISSSVFWVNIGPECITFFTILALWPVVYVLSKFRRFRTTAKIIKMLGNYRYSFFVRFWIQVYLDVGFYAIVQVKSVRVI
jgi:hypothetical protein